MCDKAINLESIGLLLAQLQTLIFGSYYEYTRNSSKNYDPDTTTLFESDPDLVRLRRHVAFSGPQTDVGSPIGAWLSSKGFPSSAEFDPSAEDINEDEINISMLHGRGLVVVSDKYT